MVKLRPIVAVLVAVACCSCNAPDPDPTAPPVDSKPAKINSPHKKGSGGIADPTVRPAPPGVKTGTP